MRSTSKSHLNRSSQTKNSWSLGYWWETCCMAGVRLGSLVFPPECVMCHVGVPMGTRMCQECTNELTDAWYSCQRCSMPLPDVIPNDDCIHCRKVRWSFSRVIALGPYRDRLREAVIECKCFGSDGLRHALALHMVNRIRQVFPHIDGQQPLLIPVPYHWSRAWTRRMPTAFNLADVISRATGWPVKARLVRRIRATRKQAMMSISQRKENVRGAFLKTNPKSLEGKHVLIVDDVLTSGSTADEVARQIKRAGPAEISVVVIARATSG